MWQMPDEESDVMRIKTALNDDSTWQCLNRYWCYVSSICEFTTCVNTNVHYGIECSCRMFLMFLPSSVKAKHSGTRPRWRCWDFEWLIGSCQSLYHFWIQFNAIWIEHGIGLSKDLYICKCLANNVKYASTASNV